MAEVGVGGVPDHPDPVSSCLHPACRGLAACSQRSHGRTSTAYFDYLGIGDDLRDLRPLPDADVLQAGNLIIQQGNRKRCDRDNFGFSIPLPCTHCALSFIVFGVVSGDSYTFPVAPFLDATPLKRLAYHTYRYSRLCIPKSLGVSFRRFGGTLNIPQAIDPCRSPRPTLPSRCFCLFSFTMCIAGCINIFG
jgi:hypothetical protein